MSSSERTHLLEPGIYLLINASTGSAVDLAGYDSRSVIGYVVHKGKNQQWELIPSGSGYSIRSVHNNAYLTVENELKPGVDIIANDYPVSWAIYFDKHQGAYSISWPNNNLSFELSRGPGDGKGGKIRLSLTEASKETQRWKFRPIQPLSGSSSLPKPESTTQHCTTTSVNPNGPAKASATTTADTVIDTESFKNDLDGTSEMLITTTTTTVTTTVTKVQRVKADGSAEVLRGNTVTTKDSDRDDRDFEVVDLKTVWR